MMTYKIGFYEPKSAYEGWGASVSLTGQPGTWKKVPSKVVTDHHGSSYYAAFDSKAEARKAAARHAKRIFA
jgi:hypothetical protein